MTMHQINTGDFPPICQPPRQLPLEKRKEANRIVKTLREQELIELSDSPWASPTVLVKKRMRFCVDYRKLNSVTRKDSYPLPKIDDTLEALTGMCCFLTLDHKSGYWQVQLNPADKPPLVERGLAVPSHTLWSIKCTGHIQTIDGSCPSWTTPYHCSCLH